MRGRGDVQRRSIPRGVTTGLYPYFLVVSVFVWNMRVKETLVFFLFLSFSCPAPPVAALHTWDLLVGGTFARTAEATHGALGFSVSHETFG